MSACNIVTIIPSNQCIGDSLRTINTNFVALDSTICSIPITIGDEKKVKTIKYKDELGFEKIQLTTKQNPSLFKTFDAYTSNVSSVLIETTNGLSSKAYNFPYESSQLNQKPYGTFDAVSTDEGYPQLTLYWTGSSLNNKTVFAMNSSVSLNESGSLSPDAYVNCFYEDTKANVLYIGGAFNEINGVAKNKFAVVNLAGGTLLQNEGSTGSLSAYPLSGFGETGSVNFITKTTTTEPDTGVVHSWLIAGGDFKSETLGRGLVIRDETTKINYPFYFNGSVHNGIVKDSYLYVVGYFDFANFGITYEGASTGFRTYTKSIARISLNSLRTSPNNCIDKDFAKNTQTLFSGSCKINCIENQENVFYIGGEFEVRNEQQILHKNLMAITADCASIDSWSLIVSGPVNAMFIDNPLSILYIGGEFSQISTTAQYYSEVERPLPPENTFYNAAAFTLDVPKFPFVTDWKPQFNGRVKKISVHNTFTDSWVYAIGNFTQVNNKSAHYIAAITKQTDNFNNNNTGKLVKWNVQLSSGFPTVANGLLVSNENVYVGGTFDKINNQTRKKFAKVVGVQESDVSQIGSLVVWDFGGKIVSPNDFYSTNFDDISWIRAESICGDSNTINKTTFPLLTESFKGLKANQLCKFFIRRPGNSGALKNLAPTDDNFPYDVKIIGWSLDFI